MYCIIIILKLPKFKPIYLIFLPFLLPIVIVVFGLIMIILGAIINLIFGKGIKVGEPLKTRQPKIVYETKYYDIKGNTVEELNSQMQAKGPRLNEEEKKQMIVRSDGDAMTRSEIKWNSKTAKRKSGCYLHDLEYNHYITFIYPRWNQPPDASPDLIEKWNRFMAGTIVHEEGHRDIELAQTEEMFPALIGLPSFPTCEELDQAAADLSNNFQEKYRKLEEDYDIRTGSGQTQGGKLQ